ncbi:MAG TPA: sulfite exporter TauE/SafE family protein [Moheibacter sp.]|nr:sulfite exporter TauE/SafE family protein [Moheibacter sp.]
MNWIEIIGYFGALFIGLVMGLTGSGGSILSIPILAYLFHYDEKTATAYSLFIVGITALLGAGQSLYNRLVNFKSVWIFGIPAIIGVLLVRRIVMPVLPEVLFHIAGFEFTRRMFIFGLFGILMLLAAYTMLHKAKVNLAEIDNQSFQFHPLMVTEGFFLGVFMGLIGAGGGFLIVPALMLIAKLPIKEAIATSLVIVCLNCLVGFFLGDFFYMTIDWNFLFVFVGISFIGILIGGILTKLVNSSKLKKVFAYFIVLMAAFIFLMEFFIKV